MRLLIAPLAVSSLAFSQANEYNPLYRGQDGEMLSRKPNAFLVEMVRQRKPGSALDAGMGQGRNSIFLASQGWDVTGIDPADEGVRQAKVHASRLNFKIHAEVTTFEQLDFGENRWGPHRLDV